MAKFRVLASQEVFFETEIEAETIEDAEYQAYENVDIAWLEAGHYGEWSTVEVEKIEE